MTKIFGYSVDLIELEGDIDYEFACFNDIATLEFSDGTITQFKYQKTEDCGVWSCIIIKKGDGFVSLDERLDVGADTYSDVLTMADGVTLDLAFHVYS